MSNGQEGRRGRSSAEFSVSVVLNKIYPEIQGLRKNKLSSVDERGVF